MWLGGVAAPLHVGGAGSLLQQQRGRGGWGRGTTACGWGWITASAAAWTAGGVGAGLDQNWCIRGGPKLVQEGRDWAKIGAGGAGLDLNGCCLRALCC